MIEKKELEPSRHDNAILLEQLGVFYVAQKLAGIGWTVHSTSFNSPIDLIIEKKNELRKIQVKTIVKRYIKNYGTFWHFFSGRTGHMGNFHQRYHDIIDYLILVCIDKKSNEYTVKRVIVFPKDEIPNSKGVRIFEKHINNNSSRESKYIRFEDRWDLIM